MFPTFTLLKLIVTGATVSWPGLVFCWFDGGVDVVLFALLRPWHPNIVARARNITSAFQRLGACFIVEKSCCPVPIYSSKLKS